MFRKILSLVLMTAILGGGAVVSAADAKKGDDEKRAEKVKTEIRKLGTGPDV